MPEVLGSPIRPAAADLFDRATLVQEPDEESGETLTGPLFLLERLVDFPLHGDISGWHVYVDSYAWYLVIVADRPWAGSKERDRSHAGLGGGAGRSVRGGRGLFFDGRR